MLASPLPVARGRAEKCNKGIQFSMQNEMHEEILLALHFRGLNRYAKCLWKDVRVGDIVRLSCDEMIPADILVCILKINLNDLI